MILIVMPALELMGDIMNKRGVTILELLISISLISVVILLLIKVMFSLDKINNDDTYASNDEIARTELIKTLESDFLKLKLKGIEIKKEDSTTINFIYENEIKELKLEKNKITYNNEAKNLASKNATYDLCPIYEYTEVDDNYYLIKISIPVLINNENTTANDDIILTYLGLKKENNNYPINYICS